MKAVAVRLAEQVLGLNGLAGQETQGHRPRIKRYAVAARPGGQFPQIRAAGRSLKPRGVKDGT